VILDLYVSDPSGSDNLRLIQEHGYTGAMMVLSGPSMMPVVNEIYSSGGSLKRVIQGPVTVNGRYDLGNLESTIQTLLEEVRHRKNCHASIAQRAYDIYESRGKMEGHNVEDWLRAEQELASGG
ncbi:MAG TPA: DUF2934 domain-containing protein, partial [Nitrospira sp.]|nr:DUF2934 domain-containing protein [Nitrospira sp.]